MAPGGLPSRRGNRKQQQSATATNNIEDILKQRQVERHQHCEVCTKIAYRETDIFLPMLMDQAGGGVDFDAGIYEYIYRTGVPDEGGLDVRLDEASARKTVERCSRHIRKLQSEMTKAGIIQQEDQRYTGEYDWARVIAPFEMDEIDLGNLLGTGGFSSVFEISGFRLDPVLNQAVNEGELLAREHLAQTAQKPVAFSHASTKWHEEHPTETAKHQSPFRYAIKHLRKGLIKEPDRFERAAIDLVLEAQLLLCMDHPNIVSLRGWSSQGVNGYLCGKHNSFFFIIDRLPEILEHRIFKWRAAVRKYRTRLVLPFQKPKYSAKLDEVLIDRLQVAHDVAAAVEYMHDRRIINRDLKATNIGFDVRGDLKLFDFGLSRLLPRQKEDKEDSYLMSRVGTKYYMAPEIRKKLPYNLSADLYSYGVCLWEILSMGSPREALRKFKEEGSGSPTTRCPLPVCHCWPDEASKIMTACLAVSPIHRPPMADVRFSLERLLERMGHKMRVDHARRRSTLRLDLSSVINAVGSVSTARSTRTARECETKDEITDPRHIQGIPDLYFSTASGASHIDNVAHRLPRTSESMAAACSTVESAVKSDGDHNVASVRSDPGNKSASKTTPTASSNRRTAALTKASVVAAVTKEHEDFKGRPLAFTASTTRADTELTAATMDTTVAELTENN